MVKLEEMLAKDLMAGLFVILTQELPVKDYYILGEVGAQNGDGSTKMFVDFLNVHKGCLISVEWFRGSETTIIEDDYKKNKNEFEETTKKYRDKFILMPVSSEQAASCIDDETFDLLFIDADHRYYGISKDIEMWYPKVKTGGIFCGHDYDKNEYDEKYINQDWHDGCHHGVTKAVNEKFKMRHNVADLCWYIKKDSIENQLKTPTKYCKFK